METTRDTDHKNITSTAIFRPSNDNERSGLSFEHPRFPGKAVALSSNRPIQGRRREQKE